MYENAIMKLGFMHTNKNQIVKRVLFLAIER